MKVTAPFFLGVAFLFYLASPVTIFADAAGVTISEPNLFSYQAPAGWILKSTPGAQYKVACDIKDDAVKAMISVEMDAKPGPLAEWTQQSMVRNKKQFADYNMQSSDPQPFETTAGLKGFRIIITLTANSNHLQFFDYFFEGKSDAKICVTCNSSADDASHYAPIFDMAMKTFVPQ